MGEILILTTVDTAELGRSIASALVEAGLAACVNLIPQVRSVYRWEGEVHDEPELLLLIKTAGAQFEAVRRRIREMHSYQVPEIIAVPIVAGDVDYLAWLRQQAG